MLDFLKQLFNKRKRELGIVIYDDREPEPSTSYRFRPAKLLYLFCGLLVISILLVGLVLWSSPLGEILFARNTQKLRSRAIGISQRVDALQDSLNAREMQLAQIKKLIRNDSSNSTEKEKAVVKLPNEGAKQQTPAGAGQGAITLKKGELAIRGLLREKPLFSTDLPVDGSLTRQFEPERGHFGIDIASSKGRSFKAIADGAVINQSWTMNYGWVLLVQHGSDYISIYKHAKTLSKSIGDMVLKGDVLGTVGDTGIMSSGPHLHLEIWRNGVPQNPEFYFIEL